MPTYGGDLVQSAPSGSAVRVLQVPTITDRDRLATNGVVRVDGLVFVDATKTVYRWDGVAFVVDTLNVSDPDFAGVFVERHIDAGAGDDNNDGKTAGSAWQTAAPLAAELARNEGGSAYVIVKLAGTFTSRFDLTSFEYRGDIEFRPENETTDETFNLAGSSAVAGKLAQRTKNVGAYGTAITATSHYGADPFAIGGIPFLFIERPLASTSPSVNWVRDFDIGFLTAVQMRPYSLSPIIQDAGFDCGRNVVHLYALDIYSTVSFTQNIYLGGRPGSTVTIEGNRFRGDNAGGTNMLFQPTARVAQFRTNVADQSVGAAFNIALSGVGCGAWQIQRHYSAAARLHVEQGDFLAQTFLESCVLQYDATPSQPHLVVGFGGTNTSLIDSRLFGAQVYLRRNDFQGVGPGIWLSSGALLMFDSPQTFDGCERAFEAWAGALVLGNPGAFGGFDLTGNVNNAAILRDGARALSSEKGTPAFPAVTLATNAPNAGQEIQIGGKAAPQTWASLPDDDLGEVAGVRQGCFAS